MSIEGPPPLKPPKSYCDVTGYEVLNIKLNYIHKFIRRNIRIKAQDYISMINTFINTSRL
jgi:hypothetical protein